MPQSARRPRSFSWSSRDHQRFSKYFSEEVALSCSPGLLGCCVPGTGERAEDVGCADCAGKTGYVCSMEVIEPVGHPEECGERAHPLLIGRHKKGKEPVRACLHLPSVEPGNESDNPLLPDRYRKAG